MPQVRTWPLLISIVLVFAFSGALFAYTFSNLPPVPKAVVTTNGQVVFNRSQIILGKYYFQYYGLMDYGSIEGMGSYFGTDFTSYTMELDELYIARQLGLDPGNSSGVPVLNSTEVAMVRQYMDPTYNRTTDEFVVSPQLAEAFNESVQYYMQYLGQNSSEYRLRPDLIRNESVVRDLVAYFTWSALISLMNYTQGFPYMKGLTSPSTNAWFATFVMLGALFAVGVPLVAYIFRDLVSHWNDPVIKVDLPRPNGAQMIAVYAMVILMAAAGVQGLLGTYLMHLYVSPSLYGLNLIPILPFNVARALHIWLAIYWIALTWVAFSLFALPYFGLNLSRRRVAAILGVGVVVALTSLIGVWLDYLGYIPFSSGPVELWFMIGAQGRDVIEVGSLWLLLVAALVFYMSYLFYRASRITAEPLRPFARVLSYVLAGFGVGVIIGALPVVHPWPYFTLDEFFRWIFIHAAVEGFWPSIVITVLALLLVLRGLIPPSLASTVVAIDAVTEVLTGMIGAAHHYYWTGFPAVWMYVGAALSILEAIPLGMAMAYVVMAARRARAQGSLSQLDRALVTFILVAGIGGSLGVVIFGAGLINAPIINYFTHDLQFTMGHAHVAFPLAYGLPSIAMWAVAFTLAGYVSERGLKWLARGAIIYGVGFYMQVLITLEPLGVLQWIYELKYGFWYVKTLVLPNGDPGFWLLPLVDKLIWLRMLGDLTAALGFAIMAFIPFLGLLRRRPII